MPQNLTRAQFLEKWARGELLAPSGPPLAPRPPHVEAERQRASRAALGSQRAKKKRKARIAAASKRRNRK